MDLPTPGLVLRLHPYSETSLIVRWLTPELGRIATLARGSLRPKSPMRGRLDLCYLADFTLVPSRRSTLHTLKEVELRETFPVLRHNYSALQHAAYTIRLIERVTESDTPLPGLFALLLEFLRSLDQDGPDPVRILAFELRLLAWSGLASSAPPVSLGPAAAALYQRLLLAPWRALLSLQAASPPFYQLERLLQNLLIEHWDISPQWREAFIRGATIRSDPTSPPSVPGTFQTPPPPPSRSTGR